MVQSGERAAADRSASDNRASKSGRTVPRPEDVAAAAQALIYLDPEPRPSVRHTGDDGSAHSGGPGREGRGDEAFVNRLDDSGTGRVWQKHRGLAEPSRFSTEKFESSGRSGAGDGSGEITQIRFDVRHFEMRDPAGRNKWVMELTVPIDLVSPGGKLGPGVRKELAAQLQRDLDERFNHRHEWEQEGPFRGSQVHFTVEAGTPNGMPAGWHQDPAANVPVEVRGPGDGNPSGPAAAPRTNQLRWNTGDGVRRLSEQYFRFLGSTDPRQPHFGTVSELLGGGDPVRSRAFGDQTPPARRGPAGAAPGGLSGDLYADGPGRTPADDPRDPPRGGPDGPGSRPPIDPDSAGEGRDRRSGSEGDHGNGHTDSPAEHASRHGLDPGPHDAEGPPSHFVPQRIDHPEAAEGRKGAKEVGLPFARDRFGPLQPIEPTAFDGGGYHTGGTRESSAPAPGSSGREDSGAGPGVSHDHQARPERDTGFADEPHRQALPAFDVLKREVDLRPGEVEPIAMDAGDQGFLFALPSKTNDEAIARAWANRIASRPLTEYNRLHPGAGSAGHGGVRSTKHVVPWLDGDAKQPPIFVFQHAEPKLFRSRNDARSTRRFGGRTLLGVMLGDAGFREVLRKHPDAPIVLLACESGKHDEPGFGGHDFRQALRESGDNRAVYAPTEPITLVPVFAAVNVDQGGRFVEVGAAPAAEFSGPETANQHRTGQPGDDGGHPGEGSVEGTGGAVRTDGKTDTPPEHQPVPSGGVSVPRGGGWPLISRINRPEPGESGSGRSTNCTSVIANVFNTLKSGDLHRADPSGPVESSHVAKAAGSSFRPVKDLARIREIMSDAPAGAHGFVFVQRAKDGPGNTGYDGHFFGVDKDLDGAVRFVDGQKEPGEQIKPAGDRTVEEWVAGAAKISFLPVPRGVTRIEPQHTPVADGHHEGTGTGHTSSKEARDELLGRNPDEHGELSYRDTWVPRKLFSAAQQSRMDRQHVEALKPGGSLENATFENAILKTVEDLGAPAMHDRIRNALSDRAGKPGSREQIANRAGVRAHVLLEDGTWKSYGPLGGVPAHLVRVKDGHFGPKRFFGTTETVHLGRAGVRYPVSAKYFENTAANADPNVREYHVEHRGEYEVQTIKGEHFVRIYTAVYDPAAPGSKHKDVQQKPDGEIDVRPGKDRDAIYLSGGRPLRAVQWVAKYQHDQTAKGESGFRPLLRSYLVPERVFREFSQSARPEAVPRDPNRPYNVDQRGDVNQFGMRGAALDHIREHAVRGSLVTYVPKGDPGHKLSEFSGRTEELSDLYHRLGIPADFTSDALGKDNDPWFSWTRNETGALTQEFEKDPGKLKRKADRLTKVHDAWVEYLAGDPAADRPEINEFVNTYGPAAANFGRIAETVDRSVGQALHDAITARESDGATPVHPLRVNPGEVKTAVVGSLKNMRNAIGDAGPRLLGLPRPDPAGRPGAHRTRDLLETLRDDEERQKIAVRFATKMTRRILSDNRFTPLARGSFADLVRGPVHRRLAEHLDAGFEELATDRGRFDEVGKSAHRDDVGWLSGDRMNRFLDEVLEGLQKDGGLRQDARDAQLRLDRDSLLTVARRQGLDAVRQQTVGVVARRKLVGLDPREQRALFRAGIVDRVGPAVRNAFPAKGPFKLVNSADLAALKEAVADRSAGLVRSGVDRAELPETEPAAVREFMAKVPDFASQARIGHQIAAQHDRTKVDFDADSVHSDLPVPEPAHPAAHRQGQAQSYSGRNLPPAELARQQEAGRRIEAAAEAELARPILRHEAAANIVQALIEALPELKDKFDEVVKDDRFRRYRPDGASGPPTFYDHAQMVAGQYLKLIRDDPGRARFVPTHAVLKAILFHDIDKVNSKNQYGTAKVRHDREPEHIGAVEYLNRYPGLWNNAHEFKVARAMVDSDPFGAYLRSKPGSDGADPKNTYHWIKEVAQRWGTAEGRESSAEDVRKFYYELEQYYQSDFSSYSDQSSYLDRDGNHRHGNNELDGVLDRDGPGTPFRVEETGYGRRFQWSGDRSGSKRADARTRIGELTELFDEAVAAEDARVSGTGGALRRPGLATIPEETEAIELAQLPRAGSDDANGAHGEHRHDADQHNDQHDEQAVGHDRNGAGPHPANPYEERVAHARELVEEVNTARETAVRANAETLNSAERARSSRVRVERFTHEARGAVFSAGEAHDAAVRRVREARAQHDDMLRQQAELATAGLRISHREREIGQRIDTAARDFAAARRAGPEAARAAEDNLRGLRQQAVELDRAKRENVVRRAAADTAVDVTNQRIAAAVTAAASVQDSVRAVTAALDEVNKAVAETDKAVAEAGAAFNRTTGHLAAAESAKRAMDDAVEIARTHAANTRRADAEFSRLTAAAEAGRERVAEHDGPAWRSDALRQRIAEVEDRIRALPDGMANPRLADRHREPGDEPGELDRRHEEHAARIAETRAEGARLARQADEAEARRDDALKRFDEHLEQVRARRDEARTAAADASTSRERAKKAEGDAKEAESEAKKAAEKGSRERALAMLAHSPIPAELEIETLGRPALVPEPGAPARRDHQEQVRTGLAALGEHGLADALNAGRFTFDTPGGEVAAVLSAVLDRPEEQAPAPHEQPETVKKETATETSVPHSSATSAGLPVRVPLLVISPFDPIGATGVVRPVVYVGATMRRTQKFDVTTTVSGSKGYGSGETERKNHVRTTMVVKVEAPGREPVRFSYPVGLRIPEIVRTEPASVRAPEGASALRPRPVDVPPEFVQHLGASPDGLEALRNLLLTDSHEPVRVDVAGTVKQLTPAGDARLTYFGALGADTTRTSTNATGSSLAKGSDATAGGGVAFGTKSFYAGPVLDLSTGLTDGMMPGAEHATAHTGTDTELIYRVDRRIRIEPAPVDPPRPGVRGLSRQLVREATDRSRGRAGSAPESRTEGIEETVSSTVGVPVWQARRLGLPVPPHLAGETPVRPGPAPEEEWGRGYVAGKDDISAVRTERFLPRLKEGLGEVAAAAIDAKFDTQDKAKEAIYNAQHGGDFVEWEQDGRKHRLVIHAEALAPESTHPSGRLTVSVEDKHAEQFRRAVESTRGGRAGAGAAYRPEDANGLRSRQAPFFGVAGTWEYGYPSKAGYTGKDGRASKYEGGIEEYDAGLRFIVRHEQPRGPNWAQRFFFGGRMLGGPDAEHGAAGPARDEVDQARRTGEPAAGPVRTFRTDDAFTATTSSGKLSWSARPLPASTMAPGVFLTHEPPQAGRMAADRGLGTFANVEHVHIPPHLLDGLNIATAKRVEPLPGGAHQEGAVRRKPPMGSGNWPAPRQERITDGAGHDYRYKHSVAGRFDTATGEAVQHQFGRTGARAIASQALDGRPTGTGKMHESGRLQDFNSELAVRSEYSGTRLIKVNHEDRTLKHNESGENLASGGRTTNLGLDAGLSASVELRRAGQVGPRLQALFGGLWKRGSSESGELTVGAKQTFDYQGPTAYLVQDVRYRLAADMSLRNLFKTSHFDPLPVTVDVPNGRVVEVPVADAIEHFRAQGLEVPPELAAAAPAPKPLVTEQAQTLLPDGAGYVSYSDTRVARSALAGDPGLRITGPLDELGVRSKTWRAEIVRQVEAHLSTPDGHEWLRDVLPGEQGQGGVLSVAKPGAGRQDVVRVHVTGRPVGPSRVLPGPEKLSVAPYVTSAVQKKRSTQYGGGAEFSAGFVGDEQSSGATGALGTRVLGGSWNRKTEHVTPESESTKRTTQAQFKNPGMTRHGYEFELRFSRHQAPMPMLDATTLGMVNRLASGMFGGVGLRGWDKVAVTPVRLPGEVHLISPGTAASPPLARPTGAPGFSVEPRPLAGEPLFGPTDGIRVEKLGSDVAADARTTMYALMSDKPLPRGGQLTRQMLAEAAGTVSEYTRPGSIAEHSLHNFVKGSSMHNASTDIFTGGSYQLSKILGRKHTWYDSRFDAEIGGRLRPDTFRLIGPLPGEDPVSLSREVEQAVPDGATTTTATSTGPAAAGWGGNSLATATPQASEAIGQDRIAATAGKTSLTTGVSYSGRSYLFSAGADLKFTVRKYGSNRTRDVVAAASDWIRGRAHQPEAPVRMRTADDALQVRLAENTALERGVLTIADVWQHQGLRPDDGLTVTRTPDGAVLHRSDRPAPLAPEPMAGDRHLRVADGVTARELEHFLIGLREDLRPASHSWDAEPAETDPPETGRQGSDILDDLVQSPGNVLLPPRAPAVGRRQDSGVPALAGALDNGPGAPVPEARQDLRRGSDSAVENLYSGYRFEEAHRPAPLRDEYAFWTDDEPSPDSVSPGHGRPEAPAGDSQRRISDASSEDLYSDDRLAPPDERQAVQPGDSSDPPSARDEMRPEGAKAEGPDRRARQDWEQTWLAADRTYGLGERQSSGPPAPPEGGRTGAFGLSPKPGESPRIAGAERVSRVAGPRSGPDDSGFTGGSPHRLALSSFPDKAAAAADFRRRHPLAARVNKRDFDNRVPGRRMNCVAAIIQHAKTRDTGEPHEAGPSAPVRTEDFERSMARKLTDVRDFDTVDRLMTHPDLPRGAQAAIVSGAGAGTGHGMLIASGTEREVEYHDSQKGTYGDDRQRPEYVGMSLLLEDEWREPVYNPLPEPERGDPVRVAGARPSREQPFELASQGVLAHEALGDRQQRELDKHGAVALLTEGEPGSVPNLVDALKLGLDPRIPGEYERITAALDKISRQQKTAGLFAGQGRAGAGPAQVARRAGLRVHVLGADGTWRSHGPVGGRPVHVLTAEVDGRPRYLGVKQVRHLGLPDVSYPGSTKVVRDRVTGVVHRGEFEVEPIAGRHYVRIYTAVYGAAEPGSGFKDVHQSADGEVSVHTGGAEGLWAGAGRPMRALKWLEKYRHQQIRQGEQHRAPLLRSYLVPLAEYTEITKRALPEDRAPRDRTRNSDQSADVNQFNLRAGELERLKEHVLGGSLVTYVRTAQDEQGARASGRSGRVERASDLYARLGISTDFDSTAFGRDLDPWFAWSKDSDGRWEAAFRNDPVELRELASRLNRMYVLWTDPRAFDNPANSAYFEPDEFIPDPSRNTGGDRAAAAARPDPARLRAETNRFVNTQLAFGDRFGRIAEDVADRVGESLDERLARPPRIDNRVVYLEVRDALENVAPHVAPRAAGIMRAMNRKPGSRLDGSPAVVLADLKRWITHGSKHHPGKKGFHENVIGPLARELTEQVFTDSRFAALDAPAFRKEVAGVVHEEFFSALEDGFAALVTDPAAAAGLEQENNRGRNRGWLNGPRLTRFLAGVAEDVRDSEEVRTAVRTAELAADPWKVRELVEDQVAERVRAEVFDGVLSQDLIDRTPGQLRQLIRNHLDPLGRRTRDALASASGPLRLVDRGLREELAGRVGDQAAKLVGDGVNAAVLRKVTREEAGTLMTEQVPEMATVAEIGAAMAADERRNRLDFDHRTAPGEPFPNDFGDQLVRYRRGYTQKSDPDAFAWQRQSGDGLRGMVEDALSSPEPPGPHVVKDLLDTLLHDFPELAKKYAEPVKLAHSDPYRVHFLKVAGQLLKLVHGENEADRFVSREAMVKLVLLHDIDKANSKLLYGDSPARHDREGEHRGAVRYLNRYEGIFSTRRDFLIARRMVHSDPIGSYLRGGNHRLTAEGAYRFIANLAREAGGPDGGQATAKDVRKFFREFLQYYQADFSSYSNQSSYVDHDTGEVRTGARSGLPEVLRRETPDGRFLTEDSAEGRLFRWNASYGDLITRLERLFDDAVTLEGMVHEAVTTDISAVLGDGVAEPGDSRTSRPEAAGGTPDRPGTTAAAEPMRDADGIAIGAVFRPPSWRVPAGFGRGPRVVQILSGVSSGQFSDEFLTGMRRAGFTGEGYFGAGPGLPPPVSVPPAGQEQHADRESRGGAAAPSEWYTEDETNELPRRTRR
ncbi:toxin glutamine deamidase domain-containing protein [Amycolatopsis sp. PS_44_ISF1]|uniref:toxin glutamine deamidase domain-containing protein n=1 Tax=Amycolatopsis sp. PS_44_ISF1 TaxID=2974917 RepID=UPI0028DE4A04|nr:toxin glutamine deamidase domain-containing protein [Amycolatopsis sp. PS_44_ISF1]MDT8912080.1 toxin glutamine deamidase domain-containing protein [Amycolatopsis sp. PS_44_ISF1]